jgi:hypothetical protein
MNKKKNSKKYPTTQGAYSAGDEIFYQRVSDGQTSYGRIWYFYTTGENPIALIIDLVLGNFQIGQMATFEPKISDKKKKSIIGKTKARAG